MTKKSREKLADYLEGFSALVYDAITPIGVVLAGSKTQKDALAELKKDGYTEVMDRNLERKLDGIANRFSAGEKIVLNLGEKLPDRVFGFFLDIARGKIPGAKVLFVMPATLYDSYAGFDRIISSVCRL